MEYKGPFRYILSRRVDVRRSMCARSALGSSLPGELSTFQIPSLPVELLRQILFFVDNTPTLAAFARASRTFHDVAIPALYNTVELGKDWNTLHREFGLFFHGLLTPADSASYDRKASYLNHLRHLMLWKAPAEHSLPKRRFCEEDLFPLFSLFDHVRHLCIRTFEGEALFDKHTRTALARWTGIEYLTFFNWFAKSPIAVPEEVEIPVTWHNLKRVVIYPALASQGIMLTTRNSGFCEPDPFVYMPEAPSFPSLEEFLIFIPRESRTYRERYSECAEGLDELEKALIDVRVGKMADSRWVAGWL